MFSLGNQRAGEGSGNPGAGGGGADGLAALQGHSKENEPDPVDDGEPLKDGFEGNDSCTHSRGRVSKRGE